MWLTIVELDLLCRHEYKLQRDQHVSSSNTLLQDLINLVHRFDRSATKPKTYYRTKDAIRSHMTEIMLNQC